MASEQNKQNNMQDEGKIVHIKLSSNQYAVLNRLAEQNGFIGNPTQMLVEIIKKALE